MKICAKEASEKTNREDEETILGFPGSIQSLGIFKEVVVDFVEEFARL